METLSEIVEFSSKVKTIISTTDLERLKTVSVDMIAKEESYSELLKLQGSVFLSSGTICGVIGPKALSVLGTLMKNILSTVESHGAQFLVDENLRNILLKAQALEDVDEGNIYYIYIYISFMSFSDA
jgi:hypothetical protein